MPNKYEREIEEILRNLERTEPHAGFGRKADGRMRQKASVRRSVPTIRLNFSEWCLAIACAAALFAGGWAYAHGDGDLLTGVVALIGATCIAIVAISPFVERPRRARSTQRYSSGNVTRIRSNPLSRVGTRLRLLAMKARYRNRRDQGE